MMRVPVAVISIESFGRLTRLLERGARLRATVNVDTEFTGDRVEGFNVFADIPGVDPVRAGEVVMVARISTAGTPAPAPPTTAPAC